MQRREFMQRAVGAGTLGMLAPGVLLGADALPTPPTVAVPPRLPERNACGDFMAQAHWTFRLRRGYTDAVRPSLDQPRWFGAWFQEMQGRRRCLGFPSEHLALAPGVQSPPAWNGCAPRTRLTLLLNAIDAWALGRVDVGPAHDRLRDLLTVVRAFYQGGYQAIWPHDLTVWWAGSKLRWDYRGTPGEEVGHVPAT